jgi:hypothetical protein
MRPHNSCPKNYLIAGGSETVEVCDPTIGKFTIAAGQTRDARHFVTETKLRDDSVLLAGGPEQRSGLTQRRPGLSIRRKSIQANLVVLIAGRVRRSRLVDVRGSRSTLRRRPNRQRALMCRKGHAFRPECQRKKRVSWRARRRCRSCCRCRK